MGRKSRTKKHRSAEMLCPERCAKTASAGSDAPDSPSTMREPSSLKKWLFATALVIAVFVAYIPAWHGGFVFDDDLHLVNNPVLKSGGLARAWAPGSYSSYWPLTFTVYRLEFETWGLNPLGFHLVNIALHAVTAILVWRVLVELNVPGPMLAAAIFALHPVNVESVAWIAQLKGILSLLFALLSTFFYLRCAPSLALQASFASRNYAARNDTSLKRERRNGWLLYTAALAAFCLSTLAKGMVITLPVVLLACAWWRRGSIDRRDLVRMVPYVLIGALMAGLEVWTQHAGGVVRSDSLPSRAAVAGCAVWFYLGKLLWPLDLCFVYPRWQIDDGDVFSYLPGLLLFAIVFALALWRRRTWGRPVVMLIVCYVGLLLPALGFVNISYMRYSLVADHWQYAAAIVPCAALTGAAAWVANGGWRAVSRQRGWDKSLTCPAGQVSDLTHPRSRLAPLSCVLGVSLLAVLAGLTWRQSGLYADAETLWDDTLVKDPNCWLAHNKLGFALAGRGQIDEAIAHYRKALEIEPDFAAAHNNLGVALAGRGPVHVDEAIAHYRSAIEIQPDYVDALNNLGQALARRGRVDEAIAHHQRALAIQPDLALVHNNLGVALAGRGRFDEAIAHYRRALEIQPGYAEAHNNLGNSLADCKQLDEAIVHYRSAIEIQPDFALAHSNLGARLTDRGQVDEAIVHYRRAIEIKSDFLEAHYNFGNALAGRGKLDEALEHYKKAFDLATARNDGALAEAIRAQ